MTSKQIPTNKPMFNAFHPNVPFLQSLKISENPLDVLKACVRYFLSNFYFSPNDSPSKTMKNVFYFI